MYYLKTYMVTAVRAVAAASRFACFTGTHMLYEKADTITEQVPEQQRVEGPLMPQGGRSWPPALQPNLARMELKRPPEHII